MPWSTKDIPDERLKVWLDFWKVILISGAVAIVIAIVPAWLNAQIQSNQLALKKEEQAATLEMARSKSETEIQLQIVKQEEQYVKTFLDPATDLNTKRRATFTQYIGALTRDEKLREGWKLLFAAAETELNQAKVDYEKVLEELKQKSGKSAEELAKVQAEAERLRGELSSRSRRDPIAPVAVRLSEVAAKHPCPADTDIVVAAVEPAHGLFVASVVSGDLEGTKPWQMDLMSKYAAEFRTGEGRSMMMVRSCVNKDGRSVGPFAILPTMPSDKIGSVGAKR